MEKTLQNKTTKLVYLKLKEDLKPDTWYKNDTSIHNLVFVVGDQTETSSAIMGVLVGSEVAQLSGTQRLLNGDFKEVVKFKDSID